MAKLKSKQTGRILFGVFIAGAIVYALWNVFDVGTRWRLFKAVQSLEMGREVAKSRETLRSMNDRQRVVSALREAVDSTDGTVLGKTTLLETLLNFKEHRVVRRAMDSKVPATQRACVWIRHNDPQSDAQFKDIVLSWLRDEKADLRYRAALLCGRYEIREAEPDLIAVLDTNPQDDEELELLRHSLGALRRLRPAGLAPKLMNIVGKDDIHESVRAEALQALSEIDDASRDDVLEQSLQVLRNKKNSTYLRSRMTNILRKPSWGSDRVWQALEDVITDPTDTDHITQRNCLSALGNSAPMERIEKLLLDRRVYRHPYWALRLDVASALAALNVRTKVCLQILLEYLVDDDPNDKQNMMRSEAYLSFFSLTGAAYGVRQQELFAKRPRVAKEKERAREFLCRHAFQRPGITPEQVDAVNAALSSLEEAKKIRQTYTSRIDQFVKAWEKEAGEEAEREKKLKEAIEQATGGDEPEKKEAIEPSGPMPPKKEDG